MIFGYSLAIALALMVVKPPFLLGFLQFKCIFDADFGH
jgi:hypothetical protein